MKIVKGFEDQDLHQVTYHSNEFIEVLEDMDTILQTDCASIFGRWIDSAREFGKKVGDHEKLDIYEINARSQVTRWGPNSELPDYASKQWSGLVKDYYLPRWSIFFEAMKDAICNTNIFVESTIKSIIDEKIVEPFNKPGNYSTYCGGKI